ncbi:MAG: GNAT family N-acetyltransferase [Leptolyngbyaceae cyanobacterium CSU_1_3]|nr:GNAT family N-acetyltransferase [Leptolyngbyaceae cyanobacterium CSU_1_3]
MRQRAELLHSNDQLVEVFICDMEERHLSDFNTIWRSMLEALDADDAFWDWARKKRLALSDERYEAYAIEFEDLTQGLMWLETQWHRSQWVSGQPLVYVAALASTPWNRRLVNPAPWLQGTGTLLLQFARKRSVDLGYGGRLGLHALPGSESFYESKNMLDLGYDPDAEMTYFEYGLVNPSQSWEEENDF